MSTAEISASKRFLDAMGPMVHDEQIVQQVILFIHSLKQKEELPKMSFEELNECIPLDVAFDKMRNKVVEHYAQEK